MNKLKAALGFWLAAAPIGCQANPAPYYSTAVDSAFSISGREIPPALVNLYVARHVGFTSGSGEVRCAYVPLGQAGDSLFIDTLCLEIVWDGDSLSVGSGRGGPLAVVVQADGDSVGIRSHATPGDGGAYAESVRRIFPAEIAERVLSAGGSRPNVLENHLRRQAAMVFTAVPQDRSVSNLLDDRVPSALAGDSGWAYEQHATIDLDDDGTVETVTLISDVRLDARGRPLWEDGHRWQVYIQSAGRAPIHVYARFLPMGKLTAEVVRSSDLDSPPSVMLMEQALGSLALYEIRYDAGTGPGLVTRVERVIEPAGSFAGSPRP
jgi:hypothetical protein